MSAIDYNKKCDTIIQQVEELEQQISLLNKQEESGMLGAAGATYKEELMKNRFKLMEKAVLSVHVNAIQTGTVSKNGKSKTYYQTRIQGLKSPPRSYSYENLIEKLYEYYFGEEEEGCGDYSFEAIFKAAIDEKIRLVAPKEKTIRDYYSSYNAFITPEFGKQDIRTITSSQLKEYIQTTSKRLEPTKKRFYKFKGVLNIAFKYAADSERNIIPMNIVPDDNAPYKKNCQMVTDRPEDKAFQPEEISMIRDYVWKRINRSKYDVNGYAILFSSHTGVRQAEIPSLKWNDIGDKLIHIHSQQNDEMRNGEKYYYYNPTTKNEKGESNDGRYIPLTKEVRHILDELKAKQKALGIDSEWVFANKDGNWITTVGYYESLYKICVEKLKLKLSNNHAFRIALNSYVLIPMGLEAPERARILGHSVETNLKHYTFSREKEFLYEVADIWDKYNENNGLCRGSTRVNHL